MLLCLVVFAISVCGGVVGERCPDAEEDCDYDAEDFEEPVKEVGEGDGEEPWEAVFIGEGAGGFALGGVMS